MAKDLEIDGVMSGFAGQRVTNEIRTLIMSGQLAPGSRIRQEELAERFSTSRIPVREALRRLESEGLVILVPNSGGWVAKLDLAECLEIYLMRERLEPLALEESVKRMTDEDVAILEDLAAQCEATEDKDEFLRLDREFHIASYQASRMPQMIRLVERFWNTTQHYRRAYIDLVWTDVRWIIFSEHRLMMEAIRRRDAEEAGRLLYGHVRRTRLELERRNVFRVDPPTPARRRRRKPNGAPGLT